MTSFTKSALKQSFVTLLNEKSFDKITVLDIVNRCGLNRNTFYYHFQDIYMLLEDIFKEEERRVEIALENDSSWEECCQESIRFCLENQKAIYHLYNSMSRENLENYLGYVVDCVLKKYISLNYEICDESDETLEFIIKFYRFGFVGLILEWISSDFSQELSDKFMNQLEQLPHHSMINDYLKKRDSE